MERNRALSSRGRWGALSSAGDSGEGRSAKPGSQVWPYVTNAPGARGQERWGQPRNHSRVWEELFVCLSAKGGRERGRERQRERGREGGRRLRRARHLRPLYSTATPGTDMEDVTAGARLCSLREMQVSEREKTGEPNTTEHPSDSAQCVANISKIQAIFPT